MWYLYIKSYFLYLILYYIIGYRKNVVLSNLKLIFPEKSKEEQMIIAKRFYRHLCELIFETIKSITISEKEISKRYQFENLDLIEEYDKKNKSILLMCGHYANWEWCSILNKKMNQQGFGVYKPLANQYFDQMVKKIRGRYGGTIVSNKNVVTKLFRNAKKGVNTVTLILSDQTPKPGAFKHRDTFMGIDVPVFTGTEELAKTLDFIPVYLKVRKVKRGYYSTRFVTLSDHPKEMGDYMITRKFLDEIEKQIHEAPQYYLWSHKRWKLRN